MSDPVNVLVIDDTPANLQLLASVLKDQNHIVRLSPSGALGLAAAEHTPPDIVLLDINMPNMDGYEVCQRLKANDALREIPVIFLSASDAPEVKVRALEAGGVDYITKPFVIEEVQARLAIHLQLHRAKRELGERYYDLRRLEALRDSLTGMVVHDLRTPLTGLFGFLRILQNNAGPGLTTTDQDLLDRSLGLVNTLVNMINTLIDVDRLEEGQMHLEKAPQNLKELAEQALDSLGSVALNRNVVIEMEDIECLCDGDCIRRVLANLLANALKFTPASEDERICLRGLKNESGIRIEVEDSGQGIKPEDRGRIFDKFGQAELYQQNRKTSSGLGLTFCKLVTEAHGGQIGVDSELGKGSLFWIELP